MATTFKVTEQLKNIAEGYKEGQEIDKPLKEYLNEIKDILRVMQADIEIIKRHTDLYQMPQPYVGVTNMATSNNEYIGGPVSKYCPDYLKGDYECK